MKTMNEDKLNELVHTMVKEMGAAATGALVVLGDRLGLYKGIAAAGRVTSSSLAERTGTRERYVREWLANQTASEFVSHEDGEYFLTPEQSAVFADDASPFLMTGGYWALGTLYKDEEHVSEAFRSGAGIPWGDHHHDLFKGVEKFFRPTYRGNLVSDWLPALHDVVQKLEAGALVADVGCGHGTSTILMAQAFPATQFVGFDIHEPSVRAATEAAANAGVRNVRFESATAGNYPEGEFDLITFFDCLHDMGDPAGALTHARRALADDGVVMLVEPMAGDRLEDNLNPVSRLYYAYSTFVCTPSSLSQDVGEGLGAQAGEARLREVLGDAGFTRVRRATETPLNLIIEARK